MIYSKSGKSGSFKPSERIKSRDMQRFTTACDGFLLFLELIKYLRYWFSLIPNKNAVFEMLKPCFC